MSSHGPDSTSAIPSKALILQVLENAFTLNLPRQIIGHIKNLFLGEQKLNNLIRLLLTSAGIGGSIMLTLNNDAAHDVTEMMTDDVKGHFSPFIVDIFGHTMAAWVGGVLSQGLAETSISTITYIRYGVSNPQLVFNAHELAKEISENNPNHPLSKEEQNNLIKILKDLPKIMEKYKRRTVIYKEIQEVIIRVQEEKSIAALRTLITTLKIKSQDDKHELQELRRLLSTSTPIENMFDHTAIPIEPIIPTFVEKRRASFSKRILGSHLEKPIERRTNDSLESEEQEALQPVQRALRELNPIEETVEKDIEELEKMARLLSIQERPRSRRHSF